MTKINNRYSHFQEVYLVSDYEQYPRQIVQINVLPGLRLTYVLSCNGETSEHYEEEVTESKRVI